MSAFSENLRFSREDLDFGWSIRSLLQPQSLTLAVEFPDDLPEKLGEELRRLEQLFTVDTAMLKKITDRFGEELQAGMEGKGDIPMNITWVTSSPTGHETGTYLTIDLGGTNLRVCLITLTDEMGGHSTTQEKYTLPKDIKTGTADQLFDHIADHLSEFLTEHVKGNEGACDDGKIPLGFTFSYPATQERIDHGILQTWTKGWDVKDVEGHDVTEMLNRAMEKRNLPVKLIALINDTTGALIASAYNDPDTVIGAIFGTGCNAAYMDRVSQIPKMASQKTDPKTSPNEDSLMAINCEYGAFDNSHTVLPRTRYDELIDEQSPRPGEQTFEKMSAGLYLGELFRQILLELLAKGVIFQDWSKSDSSDSDANKQNQTGTQSQKDALSTPYAIDTEFLSTVENDATPSLEEAKSAFQRVLAGLSPSDAELRFFRAVAKLIAIRGARLCACGASAICRRIGRRKGHVAADGSVAVKHPRFKERWECAVREILDMKMGGFGREGEGIELTSAEDGSGVGAAVICALAMGRTREETGTAEK
ncbi:hexokinase [Cladophialophora yegresii CBS 114405]|uniref:Phosphotransferase n=1 Tax=Cladophialophora yegresii CBS 114405 TaxID=1182544 RepID=W9WQA7_9EURO|nr:hexokinase [Cladophialophora yegresii CBS 114405]EXJ60574.1 hexokinase [Cladophialophora yegresii CBS 114405]